MSYIVNVIYVRGTVGQLLPFQRSLLDHTDCRYRLVANGCSDAERSALRALSEEYLDRVDVVTGSHDRVLRHGAMLERLLETEDGRYFVIADSDLLATGPASFDALLPSPSEGARCSALPVWHTSADTVAGERCRRLSGRYVRVGGSDVVVGCSYAAAYHVDRLRSIVDRWDVPLGRTFWDQLPARVQAALESTGLVFADYDTLKIVNILHHVEGWPVRIVDLPGIVHVGALSPRPGGEPSASRRVRAKRHLLRVVPPLAMIPLWRQGLRGREVWAESRASARRHATRRYVEQLAQGGTDPKRAPRWLRDSDLLPTLHRLVAPTPGERADS
jgi:hypothetical protein